MRGSPLTEDELSEILVGRQQESSCLVGPAEDLIVCSSGRYLGNVGDVMLLGAKLVDDLLIHSLVADEPHAVCSGDGTHDVGTERRLSGVLESGLHIFLGEIGVGTDHLLHTLPGGESLQDRLDRDAGTRDHRLTRHDRWVRCDQV